MRTEIVLESSYVLHTKPYRDTSLWIDFFTKEQGRLAVIAHGARRVRSPYKTLLQQFIPILITCSGKGDLLTLNKAETVGNGFNLSGERLHCGWYLNELLLRLLTRFDPYPQLFQYYEQGIQALACCHNNLEIALRLFEKRLLQELGYGLSLTQEAITGIAVQPEAYYYYQPMEGLSLASDQQAHENSQLKRSIFIGKHLLSIEAEQMEDPDVLRNAKRLMRIALAQRLGDRPLRTRAVFLQLQRRAWKA
jgi:DNA repair protein RecO (recombination protein O)